MAVDMTNGECQPATEEELLAALDDVLAGLCRRARRADPRAADRPGACSATCRRRR